MNQIDTLIKEIFTEPVISNDDKLDILLSDKKKETRSVYVSWITKFVRFTGNKVAPDKWAVRRFVAHLKEKGYKPNSINTAWFAIKLFFESRDLPWEFRKNESPAVNEDEVRQIAMEFGDLKRLIIYAKTSGFGDEKAILALSSVYGLRRAEIAALKNEDVDRKNHTIHIKTKKHGRTRTHLIPEQIRSYIEQFDFGNMPSVSTICVKFNKLCLRAGVKREYGQGNHSIRRFLDVFLIDAGIPEIMMMDYLRWKKRGSMPQRYYKKKYQEVDTRIFEVLKPILELWR